MISDLVWPFGKRIEMSRDLECYWQKKLLYALLFVVMFLALVALCMQVLLSKVLLTKGFQYTHSIVVILGREYIFTHTKIRLVNFDEV